MCEYFLPSELFVSKRQHFQMQPWKRELFSTRCWFYVKSLFYSCLPRLSLQDCHGSELKTFNEFTYEILRTIIEIELPEMSVGLAVFRFSLGSSAFKPFSNSMNALAQFATLSSLENTQAFSPCKDATIKKFQYGWWLVLILSWDETNEINRRVGSCWLLLLASKVKNLLARRVIKISGSAIIIVVHSKVHGAMWETIFLNVFSKHYCRPSSKPSKLDN